MTAEHEVERTTPPLENPMIVRCADRARGEQLEARCR
jgi:hypothetical protein